MRYDIGGQVLGYVIAAIIVIAIIFLFSIRGCGSPERVRRALEDEGYTDIELGSPRPFSCDSHDTFSNSFIATNPTGHQVEGVVCCGIWKGCTIRH